MENTEYKCLCCGFQGNQEVFSVETFSKAEADNEYEICPQCGSIDVQALVIEEPLSV
ncbi:MAG: hypothetical protein JXA77_01550 [Bacteroidales bacterium]|nr:hypothetical protein [Bacteroidales bacterium]MBN2820127.1 hypothetical protein [Bacteroidales bacterium]